MQFRVVCTDIDGTLLNAERQLSVKTIDVFSRLPDDVAVILASSRMPAAMRHLQDELGIRRHPMICYNGAYVICPGISGTDDVIHNEEISRSIVEDILSMSATTIHISLYYRDEWYAPAWDYWAEREARITKADPVIANGNDVLARWEAQKNGAHKVMCMGPEDAIARLEAALNARFAGRIHVYRSRPTYLELAPATISKGKALNMLMERSGITMTEVISFGDNYNDIELLRMSGWGVAVMNALAEVKAIANEIVGEGRHDGVAIALEKHMRLT